MHRPRYRSSACTLQHRLGVHAAALQPLLTRETLRVVQPGAPAVIRLVVIASVPVEERLVFHGV